MTILFDGICNLCESSVIFIIKRDKHGKFTFVPAQSAAGIKLQKRYGIDALNSQTIVLIKNGKVYIKSDAAVEIAKHLDGNWKFLSIAKYVPRVLRDRAYTIIARNRYKWFGKKQACMVPHKEIKKRFIA